jgi:hypothetical protein
VRLSADPTGCREAVRADDEVVAASEVRRLELEVNYATSTQYPTIAVKFLRM